MFRQIRSLFKLANRTRKAPRHRAPFARLNVEALETRLAPVIGNTGLATVVPAGTNMDGVVSLTVANNNAFGSGGELANQRMILTAAHVISNNLSQLTVTRGAGNGGAGYSVGQTFTMPQGVGLGLLDTGARPLSIRVATLGAGGAIATFQVMNQAGTYVAGGTGGLYVVPPPASSALLVAGFNNQGLANPTANATFTIAAAAAPGGGGGGVGRVPTQTVTFNLQRAGNPVNISIPVPGTIGPVQPAAANAIGGPVAGTFNNMLTPAAGGMAWTTAPGNVGANDIGIVVLRDPQTLPGVAAGQNLEMIAPFSPFENGYPVIASPVAIPAAAPPAVGTDGGQPFNVVGYGAQGVGALGIVSASGVQQINLAGFVGGGGVNFQLTFNRPAIAGFPAAVLPPVGGGFTTAAINATVPAGAAGPFTGK